MVLSLSVLVLRSFVCGVCVGGFTEVTCAHAVAPRTALGPLPRASWPKTAAAVVSVEALGTNLEEL